MASNDYISLLPYLLEDEEIQYFECPVQRDYGARYLATSNNGNRNPFVPSRQNSDVQSRGSFLATLISEADANNVVTRVYQWEIVEPVIISPLVWGKCFSEEGLANIQNITLQMKIQDLQRSISVANAALPENTSVKMDFPDNNCTLLLNYCTQDPVLAAKMPSTLYYNWDMVQIDANSRAIGAALNNTSLAGKFNGNALRLSTIPDKIYVCIKPSKSNFNGSAVSQTTTDTFLRITQLRVQFQNTANILGSFSEYDLWRMSVKNGLKMSWNEWRYSNGSIVVIDVASDLGLKSDQAAGEQSYNQIKIDGDYDCTPLVYAAQEQAVDYDVMTIIVTPGEAIVTPNLVKYETAGIDASQVLALSTMQDSTVGGALHRQLSTRGGSLFSNVGKYLHKGLKVLQDNPDYVSKGAEYARKGLDSLGVGAGITGGIITGGKLVRRHKRVA